MEMTLAGLVSYLTACRDWQPVDCLVLGHAAPDGDAVFSSLFEAWRRYLTDGARAVPVVQAAALPRETVSLLGEAAPLLLTREALSRYPDTPLVLTDHYAEPAWQHRVIGVVDHHHLDGHTDLAGVDATIRPVGAATTLVAQRCRQQGLVPDSAVAGMLLGAILLDTDGLSPHKAKPEDTGMAAWLAALSGEQPMALYARLRGELLSETDPATLYDRDYRLYADPAGAPLMGFAILKVWDTAMPDREQVRRLLAADAARRGCRVCVAKISLYSEDGLQEEYYLTAGEPEAAAAVLETVLAAAGSLARRTAPDEVYLPAPATHRGRKWLALRLLERLCG